MDRCKNCGLEMKKNKSFCSNKCCREFNSKMAKRKSADALIQYNLNPNKCLHCGGNILCTEGRLCDVKKQNYCCRKCRYTHKGLNYPHRKNRFCVYCGKPHRRKNAKYCSQECVNKVKEQRCWDKVENNEQVKSYIVKRYLIKERGHGCQNCSCIEWMGKIIPIELHHINGDCTDHRKENLLLLCPNCHAQTNNYKFKNKNSKRKKWPRKKKY